MGVASTLVSPAGQYLSGHRLDPSGCVAIMTLSAPLTLVNLDAPGHSLTIADQSGISYLDAIVPRRP